MKEIKNDRQKLSTNSVIIVERRIPLINETILVNEVIE